MVKRQLTNCDVLDALDDLYCRYIRTLAGLKHSGGDTIHPKPQCSATYINDDVTYINDEHRQYHHSSDWSVQIYKYTVF